MVAPVVPVHGSGDGTVVALLLLLLALDDVQPLGVVELLDREVWCMNLC